MYDIHGRHLSKEEIEERKLYRLERLRIMKERSDEEKLKQALEHEGKRLQKEREENSLPQKINLFNPRWEHTDKTVRDKRPDFVYIGDTIKLIVDQENGDNSPIEFLVKDRKISSKIDPECGVDEILSKIESFSPEVEWTVSDPRSTLESERDMLVYFFAACKKTDKNYSSENCEIKILDRPDIGYILSL